MPKFVQIPIQIAEYTLSSSSPFPRITHSKVPTFAAETLRKNQPNRNPRQQWFEAQVMAIAEALGTNEIPIYIEMPDGARLRMDKGCIGFAVANGFLQMPRNSGAFVEYVVLADTEGVIRQRDADDGPFDPDNIQDARERIFGTIVKRRGQKAFRDALIEAYDGRCAITGCAVLDVLEAAHIHPYRGQDTNKTCNGLLMRADLHTLFDCSLISIDHENHTVLVASHLRGTEYGQLHGRTLLSPRKPSQAPNTEALKWHRAASKL